MLVVASRETSEGLAQCFKTKRASKRDLYVLWLTFFALNTL